NVTFSPRFGRVRSAASSGVRSGALRLRSTTDPGLTLLPALGLWATTVSAGPSDFTYAILLPVARPTDTRDCRATMNDWPLTSGATTGGAGGGAGGRGIAKTRLTYVPGLTRSPAPGDWPITVSAGESDGSDVIPPRRSSATLIFFAALTRL